VNTYIKLAIWVAVGLAVFAYAWRKGYIRDLANYVQQTREELRKCTWPNWDELKGSTVLVSVSIALLGGFIVVVDFVLVHVNNWILK
jgi:preprotein translocase subunit SecE